MLEQIALRTTIFAGMVGLLYSLYYTVWVRQPFGDLIACNYGVIFFLGMAAFWFAIWCLTPSRWWKS